jgi:hypothetical protein
MADETRPQEIERRLKEGDVKIIHRLHDRFEQEVLHQALEQDGIVHEMRLSFEHAYSFLFEFQQGYGVVLVRNADAERATELIAAVLATDEVAAAQARVEAEQSVADEEAPVE